MPTLSTAEIKLSFIVPEDGKPGIRHECHVLDAAVEAAREAVKAKGAILVRSGYGVPRGNRVAVYWDEKTGLYERSER